MAIEPWIAPPRVAEAKVITALPGMALLLAIALTLAACEYPGVTHPLAAQAASTALATASPTPTPSTAQNPDSGTQEPPPLTGKAQVSLKDFRLDPDRVTVKAGATTFVLKNEGRYTHDFRVEGQGVDEKAPKVGQGRTFEWQITLAPGAYRISCPISNHADRGMSGSLEVAP
ncbi:MAG: cupredoxin domain-containing protein [Chloroflexi bacterium]|nr:cupredoxin domain-containing protein [Chloroflexota bacterium]